jgi:hypothetical protein
MLDPNETLKELRDLVRAENLNPHGRGCRAPEIAEKFADLDDWLSKGGFPPSAWEAADFERPKGEAAMHYNAILGHEVT